jgi:hypothetical protein
MEQKVDDDFWTRLQLEPIVDIEYTEELQSNHGSPFFIKQVENTTNYTDNDSINRKRSLTNETIIQTAKRQSGDGKENDGSAAQPKKKTYPCNQCGKKYSYQFSLYRHISKEHSLKKCSQCNELVKGSARLKSHICCNSVAASTIYLKPNEESQNIYTCRLCAQKFAKTEHWLDHVKLHSNKTIHLKTYTLIPRSYLQEKQ